MSTTFLKKLVAVSAEALTSACAFDGQLQRPEATFDPYESTNRKIFAFNDGFYEHVMFPIAKGYRKPTTCCSLSLPIRSRISAVLPSTPPWVWAVCMMLLKVGTSLRRRLLLMKLWPAGAWQKGRIWLFRLLEPALLAA